MKNKFIIFFLLFFFNFEILNADKYLFEVSNITVNEKGNLINDELIKKFRLENGKVINNEKSKINIFEFEQIDFSLHDLNSKTITVPKLQEIDTITLLSCFSDRIINKLEFFDCKKKNAIPEIKRELFKRIYKPIFLPIITLLCGFLIIKAKNSANFRKYNFLIFIITFLILVFSEASMRYVGSSNYLTILCLIVPLIILTISYSIFYKITKNV